VTEQLLALLGGEIDVGIEQQRGNVVLRQAGTQALEVDQADFPGAHDEVLALEIAMHETARFGGELVGDGVQPFAIRFGRETIRQNPKMAPEAVLEKIVLLPAIQRCVEDGLEKFQLVRARCAMSLGVQQ